MRQNQNGIIFFQRDVWICFSASFFLLYFGGFFIGLLVQSFSPSLSYAQVYYIPAIIAQGIPVVYLAYRYGRISFSDFKLIGSDVIVLFITLIIVFAYIGLITLKGPYKPYTFRGEKLSQLSRIGSYIFIFNLVIWGPLLEEIFFRKYILEIFNFRINVVWALLLTSSLETILHIGYVETTKDIPRLIPIFLIFVALSFIYLKSRLGVTFIAHSLLNGLLLNISWG
ncbi:MAG: CPBP family intramembrane metalloprotease [Desulfobacterales bacterium]|nr:MAG: CPBP family intramembrane metalloprotease [Desulfobacterales bacterium]